MDVIHTNALSNEQITDYNENGFLILRNVLSPNGTHKLRNLVEEHAPSDSYSLNYPEPGKYTISGNKLGVHPGFAPIAEHPEIIDAVECLLGARSHLSAYVAYVRTPGDKGSRKHNDYKRWRPVGSSMNWLFAIVPLTDFNSEFGPLLVSPKSHKLHRIIDTTTRIWDVKQPDTNDLNPFIDPELKAGDLMLLNMYTWHWAPGGNSTKNRSGMFNKYCAVNAPPAAGHYQYNQAAHSSLSDLGKRLLALHTDMPLMTTRLLIDRPSTEQSDFLLVYDIENQRWDLPGGTGWEEKNQVVGWDVGSRIGSLQSLVRTQLDLNVSWMSYICDVEEPTGLCRVYGYTDTHKSFAPSAKNDFRCDWFTQVQLNDMFPTDHYIPSTIRTWQRGDIIRGKGKACNQSAYQFD